MKWLRILSIDLETFSAEDLKKAGLYKYVSSPTFRILLFAYRYVYANAKGFKSPVRIIDLAKGEKIPANILADLCNPLVLKKSFNAQFERVALSQYMYEQLDPAQWRCTMIKCASLGLPMSLGHAAVALGLPEEKNKDGKALINYFCKPCKPTKANGGRTVNQWSDNLEKWNKFKRYCIQDVVVEDAIDERLTFFDITEKEHTLWQLDQRINDHGVYVYPKLINQAIKLYDIFREDLFTEARELTGLDNPNSNAQLKKWLQDELPFEAITSLDKHHVSDLLKSCDDETIRRVLIIRQETSKSSIDKYTAMATAMNADFFIRGILQFYGARTGRWAGRIVQPQNLIRNSLKPDELDYARRLVLEGNIAMIELEFESLSFVLSQLIRTAFIPKDGCKLIVSDFKQIEARVLAWLAKEEWKLDVFRSGVDIYKVGGSRMFNMPQEAIVDDFRQRAKIAELACGYQGARGAIKRMWPKYLLLPSDEEIDQMVNLWRAANRRIKQLWYDVQAAAIQAIRTGKPCYIANCYFVMDKGTLFCHLPSGRSLAYLKPRLYENQWGKDGIMYYGINQTTRQWQAIQTYGGKLVENIVQAIARDLLGEKMLMLDKYGFPISFHVHDEVGINSNRWDVDKIKVHKIMKHPIDWAQGLPLDASTDILNYYKKD